MDTFFALPERASLDEFKNSLSIINENIIFNRMLLMVDGLLAILNQHRQILAVNDNLLQLLGVEDKETILGLRPGEAIGCIHSGEMSGGCGTSEFCASCGAAIAIVSALAEDNPVERMCALVVSKNGSPKEIYFRVRAYPVTIGNQKLILLFLQDVTSHQQWTLVEKVFFHDISNIIQILISASQILADQQPFNNLIQTINKMAVQLSNEVTIQQSLIKTGMPNFKPLMQKISISQVIYDIRHTISNHPASHDKKLIISEHVPNITFASDLSLVCRVLVNMLINAFEASNAGDAVNLSVEADKKRIVFKVRNMQPIDPIVARRVFQRNFSTKGEWGRGFGTYSMKLLGEKILGGNVSFTSLESEGTTFWFSLPF
ncbi:MAG: ATP-binding protein [Desulfobacterales bacterium]|jgi:signal transduction histidine kinase|nr:ATP-binding protein [Desulfobacterales bacterium]